MTGNPTKMGTLLTLKMHHKVPYVKGSLHHLCLLRQIYLMHHQFTHLFVCLSLSLCFSPVPGSLSSLLHLRNRQRQPLPASMPGTLPDPTMQGSSAVLMPVSTLTHLLTPPVQSVKLLLILIILLTVILYTM